MTARLNPYLSFDDTAADAMEFYRSVFGGELQVNRFRDMPMPGIDDSDADKVMHAMLAVSDSVTIMGADTPSSMERSANGTVSLSGDDDATLRAWWGGLSEGATVTMPLEVAPWGDAFGQLTDRFGVAWMFNIAVPGAAS
jgi:PhnB protein